jgi:hypothetical protein
MTIYVNCAAPKDGNGSKETPFRSINDAAKIAKPGDEVLVAPGIYRESVVPENGGTEDARIVYKSEVPLGAVITGAEEAKGWEHYEGNVWVYRVDNGVFGNYNPYTTWVGGDWYFAPVIRHTGAVYLNCIRPPGTVSFRFINGIRSRKVTRLSFMPIFRERIRMRRTWISMSDETALCR